MRRMTGKNAPTDAMMSACPIHDRKLLAYGSSIIVSFAGS